MHICVTWPQWVKQPHISAFAYHTFQRNLGKVVQVMAWCLMAPSYYLNQSWFLFGEGQWHLPERNFSPSVQATILYNVFENHIFEFTATFPSSQWITSWMLIDLINIICHFFTPQPLFSSGLWINCTQSIFYSILLRLNVCRFLS